VKTIRWEGKNYKPGFIPEWCYEHYIDVAYGRGENLANTKLWSPEYKRGFVCPDEEGGWLAFAVLKNDQAVYLGQYKFDDVFEPDEPEEDELWRADELNNADGIRILRKIYLEDHPTVNEYRIATDPQCFQLICDYWEYVKRSEHGNECCLSEVMFDGFVSDILDPERVTAYLIGGVYDGDDANGLSLADIRRLFKKYDMDGSDEIELIRRYREMNKKYGQIKTENKRKLGWSRKH